MTRAFILSASIADPDFATPDIAARLLQQAEAAGLDLLLIGRAGAAPFDPQVLAAWAAPRLTRMAVVPVVSTRLGHPFHVARALSAVDYLAGGLLGWNPVAEGDASPDHVADMACATRALWDGWAADTLVIDKASGHYLDRHKVRPSNYEGPWYKTKGPVNAMRPLQGHPVLVLDAASPFHVEGADIAIAGEGEVKPAAARQLRRVTPGADPAALRTAFDAHLLDGIHIDLEHPTEDLALIAERFAPLAGARPASGTLRERLRLPLAAQPADIGETV